MSLATFFLLVGGESAGGEEFSKLGSVFLEIFNFCWYFKQNIDNAKGANFWKFFLNKSDDNWIQNEAMNSFYKFTKEKFMPKFRKNVKF
jgi:hypothetical protein